MAQQHEPGGSGDRQSIEKLQQRYSDLNAQKIAAETELKGAKRLLDGLKSEALAKYGTDDVGQLAKKLSAMKEENEEKRAQYQADLDQIERNLAEVEQGFVDADATASATETKR